MSTDTWWTQLTILYYIKTDRRSIGAFQDPTSESAYTPLGRRQTTSTPALQFSSMRSIARLGKVLQLYTDLSWLTSSPLGAGHQVDQSPGETIRYMIHCMRTWPQRDPNRPSEPLRRPHATLRTLTCGWLPTQSARESTWYVIGR